MFKTAHKGIEGSAVRRLRCVLLQPFAECGIERLVAGFRHQTCLLAGGDDPTGQHWDAVGTEGVLRLVFVQIHGLDPI